MKDQEKTIITKEEFEKKLLAEEYDFSYRIFAFDVGEVFKKVYRDLNGKWWDYEGVVYTFSKGKTVNFSSAIFKTEINFSYALFEEDTNFSFANFEGKTDFSASRFKGDTGFNYVNFKGKTDFSATCFEGDTDFGFANFEGTTSFSSSYFEEDINFSFANFERTTYFYNVLFKEKIEFIGTRFVGGINFREALFDGETNFSSSHFAGKTVFNDARFKGETNFNSSLFEGETYFRKIKLLSSTIIFDKAIFSNTVIFDDINKTASKKEQKGIFLFHNVTFRENASFHNTSLYCIDIKYTLIEKQIHLINSKVIKPTREYYRIIKHQLLQQNNKIEALQFLGKEMDVYRKDTFERIKKGSFRERGNHLLTYLLLVLNKISNNYGLSSSVALLFTLGVGAIMYNLSLYFSGVYIYEWGFDIDNWTNFLKFIIPTHGLDYLDTEKVLLSTKFGFVLFDLLGRIFIGYGIYQFIKAFRRYKES